MDINALTRLRDNVTSVYLGNATAVDRVVTCLLARGHVLIEDVPESAEDGPRQLPREIDRRFILPHSMHTGSAFPLM